MGCDLTFPGCKGEMWAERCKQGELHIKKAERRAMWLAEGCLQAEEERGLGPCLPQGPEVPALPMPCSWISGPQN